MNCDAFDCRAIFSRLVAFGRAYAAQPGADHGEAEGALIAVLNPRGAAFPEDLRWAEAQRRWAEGVNNGGGRVKTGWTQELAISPLSPDTRNALLAVGFGLADLRGATSVAT